MSTKAQLRTMIKREARIKSSTNLDPMVDDIVNDILRDYTNKSRYHELLKEDVVVTLVDGQAQYSLPVDFQSVAGLRFGRGPTTPAAFRRITPMPETVAKTWSNNWPMYFRLVGTKISLWPYGQVLATDQLLLDYYADPASVYANDGDAFPIPKLESVVKKEAIARLQRFHSSTQEAAATQGDASKSFVAAQSNK